MHIEPLRDKIRKKKKKRMGENIRAEEKQEKDKIKL